MYLGLASQGRRGPARMSGAGVDTACTTCPACLPQGPVRDVAAVTAPRLAAGTRQGRRLGSLSVFGHTVTAGHRLQDMRTLVSPAGGSGRCHPSCKEKQRSGAEPRCRHPTLSPGLGLLPFLSPALLSSSGSFSLLSSVSFSFTCTDASIYPRSQSDFYSFFHSFFYLFITHRNTQPPL